MCFSSSGLTTGQVGRQPVKKTHLSVVSEVLHMNCPPRRTPAKEPLHPESSCGVRGPSVQWRPKCPPRRRTTTTSTWWAARCKLAWARISNFRILELEYYDFRRGFKFPHFRRPVGISFKLWEAASESACASRCAALDRRTPLDRRTRQGGRDQKEGDLHGENVPL